MSPGRFDLDIWVGNTAKWRFEFAADATTPFDLTGSELLFTLFHDGPPIVRTLTIDDAAEGKASLMLTVDDTRAVCAVRGPARYEVERRIDGNQNTLLFGAIRRKGGANND